MWKHSFLEQWKLLKTKSKSEEIQVADPSDWSKKKNKSLCDVLKVKQLWDESERKPTVITFRKKEAGGAGTKGGGQGQSDRDYFGLRGTDEEVQVQLRLVVNKTDHNCKPRLILFNLQPEDKWPSMGTTP